MKANGEPVKGQNIRGEGWTIKLSEINFPQVDGLEFGEPRFAASEGVEPINGGREALVTIKPRTNAEVTLFNTAKKGEVSFTKLVEGAAKDQVDSDQRFEVRAVIDGSDIRTFYIKANDTKALKDLPIGAEVFFEEIKPVDTDVITWGEPVFTKNPITVGEDAAVTLTNTANASEGTFALKKVLNGAEASNAQLPESYKVLATWGDNGSKEIFVPANGEVEPSARPCPPAPRSPWRRSSSRSTTSTGAPRSSPVRASPSTPTAPLW